MKAIAFEVFRQDPALANGFEVDSWKRCSKFVSSLQESPLSNPAKKTALDNVH